MNVYNFKQFHQDLQQAKTTRAADQCLIKAMAALGFDKLAYTYYGDDFHTSTKLSYDFCTSNLKRWHTYFHDMGYEGVDEESRHARKSVIPVVWVVKEQLAKAKGRAIEMFEDALKFGMKSGLSVPVHGPDNQFSILSLQHKDEFIREYLDEHPEIYGRIYEFVIYYHHALTKLLICEVRANSASNLTKRELQCLALTAKNKSAQQVADELGIKKRTVDFHIENVNKKLGTKNKYESVRIASTKSLINS